jgi:hypothetical protein
MNVDLWEMSQWHNKVGTVWIQRRNKSTVLNIETSPLRMLKQKKTISVKALGSYCSHHKLAQSETQHLVRSFRKTMQAALAWLQAFKLFMQLVAVPS